MPEEPIVEEMKKQEDQSEEGKKKQEDQPEESGFEKLLDDKTKRLEQIKGDIDEKTEEKNNLEGEIKSLNTKVSEVSNIVSAYEKEFNNIKKDIQGLKDYRNKLPIEKPNMDKKGDIETVRKDFDNGTTAITKTLENLDEDYEGSKKIFGKSQVNFNKVNSDYEDLKNLQKKIQDEIKDINNLQSRIDKCDEVLDAEKRYFLILELDTVLKKLKEKIIDPDILKSSLYDKLKDLDSERQTRDIKEKEMKKAKNTYEEKKGTLELREKNRRELIIQKIIDP